MLTSHWVYILEDANGFLLINFTSEIDNIQMKGDHVVYLRSFHSRSKRWLINILWATFQ